MTTNNLGLYIHIPFCRQKCKYCDFLSFPCTSEQVYREYVTALCMEMDSRREDCESYVVDSVFIGGGTPSLISPEDIRRLMDTVRKDFHLAEDAEITIETNPASITQAKLDAYLASGINRPPDEGFVQAVEEEAGEEAVFYAGHQVGDLLRRAG